MGAILSVRAEAAIIIDNTISGSITNTFESQSVGNVAGFITETGASYGESFAGQSLGTAGGFDALTGIPSGPLALSANASAASNILISNYFTKVILGDLNSQIGEGAVSILFNVDTTVLGFNVLGSNAGTLTAQFFSRNGALLGSITQAIPAIQTGAFFGFRATGGDLIAGVSLTNTDDAGIGFDNVTFNEVRATAPEPASMLLLGTGLVGAGLRRWRQRRS